MHFVSKFPRAPDALGKLMGTGEQKMEKLKFPRGQKEWKKLTVLWRDGLPRRQRARWIELNTFWHNDTSPEFRQEFGDDFSAFECYVMREAVRLIESAALCGQQ
jgi:hypothetical protein